MTRVSEGRQSIEIDRALKLITVSVSGFCPPELTHRLTMETRKAVTELRAEVSEHLALYDFTDAATPPPETIELLRIGFGNPVYKSIRSRKLAFVTNSHLIRLQLLRLKTSRPDMRVFDDKASALAWLTSDAD